MLKEFLTHLQNEYFSRKLITMRGYLGPREEWNQIYQATLTSEEMKYLERQLDPKIDNCLMDTLFRVFPEKIHSGISDL